jgi:hypothetical protein
MQIRIPRNDDALISFSGSPVKSEKSQELKLDNLKLKEKLEKLEIEDSQDEPPS